MSVRPSKDTKRDIIIEKQRLLAQKEKLIEGLPHLYGYKDYAWSKKVFHSFKKLIFLSAANQIGKSSVGIRKAIHWATEPSTWPKISRLQKPTLMFYFYPSLKLARQEIHHKWIPQFLPRGEFKEHERFGWKLVDNSDKLSIRFNTGVEIVFLGYSQGKSDILALAASSPGAIFIDEEMNPELWPEVTMRVEATRGCIMFLATPVFCYPFYKEIFEGRTVFEDSLVLTVSMYQCLKFEDGTEGMYRIKDIENRKARLGSQAEIDKRIFGKYVTPEGLMYEQFRREKNVKEVEELGPYDIFYAGIDIGSSGGNHPAAIAFVAVSPNYRAGRVVEVWRGTPHEQTSNSDILNKYLEMRDRIVGNKPFGGCYYDWANKDFEMISLKSMVTGLQKADKARDFGIQLINALFKNEMLTIDQTDCNEDLVNELEAIRVDMKKNHAKDDLCDALRYAVSRIPWDFSHISIDKTMQNLAKKLPEPHIDERNLARPNHEPTILDSTEEEIGLWKALLED